MSEDVIDIAYAQAAVERKREMGLMGASTVKALEWSIAEIERLRAELAAAERMLAGYGVVVSQSRGPDGAAVEGEAHER